MISTAQDLADFRDKVNGGEASAWAKLTQNITLSSENWTPIGNDYYSDIVYKGTFDGCGYKITGLTINGEVEYAGLFGCLAGGTVMNLTLDGLSISGSSGYVGGIAGYSDGGTAENCSVTGEISGATNAGGIFGYAAYGTRAANCSSASTVNGEYAGGIVGYIYGKDIAINFCSNGGAVDGDSYGGGIVGNIAYDSEIVLNSCLNSGEVKSRTAGGIAGILEDNSTAELSGCSNSGAVIAENGGTWMNGDAYAGGIFGSITVNTAATLKNCSNSGGVAASDIDYSSVRTAYAGGISGYINNSGSTITLADCVNGGTVTAASDNGTEYSGGIAGYVYGSALDNVTNCAYPTGMKATGGNSYGGETAVSGAYARDNAASYVVSVYAEITPRSIAPGETATITFKTAPGDYPSAVSICTEDNEYIKAPASSSSDIAEVTGWNTSEKTITVTGVSEGTAVIEFYAALDTTQIGSEPAPAPAYRSYALPVTVTAIPSTPTDPSDPTDPSEPTDPSDPTDPSQPAGPDNSGDGGGGCSAGFGALALLALVPLALKRRK